jgi:hypothetical protein
MGRTIPSFRIASAIEENNWKKSFQKYSQRHSKQYGRVAHMLLGLTGKLVFPR